MSLGVWFHLVDDRTQGQNKSIGYSKIRSFNSQEDIGKTLVNLGASRMNSVSIYFEKTQDIELWSPCFRVSRWRRHAAWMFLNLGKVFRANPFGGASSKGIEYERKFMIMMMSIVWW